MILDFCDIPDLMTHLQENYRYWKEKSEEEASWWSFIVLVVKSGLSEPD